MPKIGYSILILIAIWATIIGAGIYMMRAKTTELEQVERAERVAQLKKAELEELFLQETRSEESAKDATRRWFARYKVIPSELSSPEVVSYLNSLTQAGFKNFDVTSNGTTNEEDISFHNYSIEGRGYFSSLYQYIWKIENNRDFYRINDLTLDQIDLITEDKNTNKQRLEVMVSFRMSLNAYFSGTEGVSAPEEMLAQLSEGEGLPSGWSGQLPPVPKDILPDEAPAINPFYPGILERLPPNTEGLLDMEADGLTLVSIAGGKAIFEEDEGFRTLGVGDPVYLGQITDIDPIDGRVVARLNKGGIIDRVEVSLGSNNEGYRQAMGGTLLAPTGNW